MYWVGNKDHCHTNSNASCIHCIQLETGTNIIPNLIVLYSMYQCILYSVNPMGNEDHSHTVSDSHCIQCIGKTRTTVIPILILTVFSVFVGNEDHCHTDFNFHWIQWIRWETRTAVSLILVLIVFTVPGKPEPLSYWFMFWLYSVYPRKSEDHSHTDSNSDCIQCIRWETTTAVIPILILTVFSVSDGKQADLSLPWEVYIRCEMRPKRLQVC